MEDYKDCHILLKDFIDNLNQMYTMSEKTNSKTSRKGKMKYYLVRRLTS